MARKTRAVKKKYKSPQNINTFTTVPKRKGRPGVTDIPLLTAIISLFKERLFTDNGNVVGRSDPVWFELSHAFNDAIRINNSFSKPKDHLSMYTYVVCNKNGIRSDLNPPMPLESICLDVKPQISFEDSINSDLNSQTPLEGICLDVKPQISFEDGSLGISSDLKPEISLENSSTSIHSDLKPQTPLEDSSLSTNSAVLLGNQFVTDTTLNHSDNVTDNTNSFSFIISVQGCDFDQLTEIRVTKDRSRASGSRKRLRFKKDEWSRWCNEKIYSVTKTSCGFFFDFHHLNQDGKSGHIAGHCNCGSVIDITLRRNEENVISMKCTVTNPTNKKKCGKIYLRGKERIKIGTTLQTTSTNKYRTKKLDQLMEKRDDCEPAIVPNAPALRTAKSQVALRPYLDADPLKAVKKMQLKSMKNIIYNIGLKSDEDVGSFSNSCESPGKDTDANVKKNITGESQLFDVTVVKTEFNEIVVEESRIMYNPTDVEDDKEVLRVELGLVKKELPEHEPKCCDDQLNKV